jgi:hypothetical protein
VYDTFSGCATIAGSIAEFADIFAGVEAAAGAEEDEAAALASAEESVASASLPSEFTFGLGIEGNARDAPESFALAVAAEVSAIAGTETGETFATNFADAPLCGSAPSKSRVATSIGHLTSCE